MSDAWAGSGKTVRHSSAITTTTSHDDAPSPTDRHAGSVERDTNAAWTEQAARVERVADLLHEAAETHHRVYRITDGADDDWASWYADWLARLSELPEVLGREPIRSALTHELVAAERDYTAQGSTEPWEQYYAARLVRDLG